MNARELTAALGGKWHGRYGTARCPAHLDKTPSLTVRDGDDFSRWIDDVPQQSRPPLQRFALLVEVRVPIVSPDDAGEDVRQDRLCDLGRDA